jgi:hypothetical protein
MLTLKNQNLLTFENLYLISTRVYQKCTNAARKKEQEWTQDKHTQKTEANNTKDQNKTLQRRVDTYLKSIRPSTKKNAAPK